MLEEAERCTVYPEERYVTMRIDAQVRVCDPFGSNGWIVGKGME